MIFALLLACNECDVSCRIDRARKAYGAGDLAAVRAEIAAIPDDPTTRDLVRLQLATDDPAQLGKLCVDAETSGARTKCEAVIGRPHLQGASP